MFIFAVTLGKNKPLSGDRPKWQSEIPITIGQLRSKRDEYWETQPAFDGRREIWDALRAACETDDQSLAQAIVNGASISLPTGKKNVTIYFIFFFFRLRYIHYMPI